MTADDRKSETSIEAKPLTTIKDGTMCRLVDVVERGPRFRRRMAGHGRRGAGHGGRHRGLGRHHHREMVRRIMDLGLTRGCTFLVVHGGGRGPVLVEVRGTRIALGHRLAAKILVKEV
ncbi:MAG: hypothetical protein GQ580_02365 [Candidatus Thorarchaeota archaeon]|nr:hypothetical protein [Candidatus Thorarchaeota archaeon]